MKKNLTLFALVFSCYIFAQQTIETPPAEKAILKDDNVIAATFPQGNKFFSTLLYSKFIIDNVDCSVVGIQKTLIEFIVEKDGSTSNIKSFGNNESLNAEVTRTVKSIRQKWNAATLNGQKVRSKYKQPFKLVCQ